MNPTPSSRRSVLTFVFALLSACVVRARPMSPHERRVARRVRRRTRRRIRRRVAWRALAGRRVVVVPVDLDGDDVIVLEDGRVATVVETNPSTGKVLVEVDGNHEELDAAFEGEVGENPSDPSP